MRSQNLSMDINFVIIHLLKLNPERIKMYRINERMRIKCQRTTVEKLGLSLFSAFNKMLILFRQVVQSLNEW